MNRTLRRPMFRTGGSTEGITSGLAPRQGYKENGSVKKFDENQMLSDYLRNASIGDVRRLSKEVGYKPRGASMSDFLIDFGLDIASRPPSGSIFSTAAAAAKDPFSRYTGAKQTAAEQQYASESDMFKTMLGAQADILAAEAEGKAEGKGWLEQWKFEQIPILNTKIAELEEEIALGTLSKDELKTKKGDLKTAKDQRRRIVEIDPILENRLKHNKYLVDDEIDRLWNADKALPEEEQIYINKKDLQLELDAMDALRKRYGLATGGRVNYQIGGDVMPGQPMQAQAAGPMDQGPAPEDTAGITYEELRARLPQEITDDIVRLLANSAEALEDFAMIQTEQDINTFNKKYGVTLVLPSEG